MGFQGSSQDALYLICLVLKKLGFDWQIPTAKDCKLKCRNKLDNEPLLNDEVVIQDYLIRKFLRFNIQIFKEPSRADLRRSRGASETQSTLMQ